MEIHMKPMGVVFLLLSPEQAAAMSAMLDIADDVLQEDGYDAETGGKNRKLIAEIQERLSAKPISIPCSIDTLKLSEVKGR
jgi:hypothetical protein